MTQYHHLDDSGDPGLTGAVGSSSHFALAMVQLPDRQPLPELALVRNMFHLPAFEFKFQKTTAAQRAVFFESIQEIPFRVRAVVVDKSRLHEPYALKNGQEFAIEFIAGLTLRASELDLANDVLVIDGAPQAFRRALRVRLSEACRQAGRRNRPFKKIVGGDSHQEDGLQLADMIVGAVRRHVQGCDDNSYKTFENKIVDLWRVGE